MKKLLIILAAAVFLLGTAYFLFGDKIKRQFFAPRVSTVQQGVESIPTAVPEDNKLPDVEVVAQNLSIPWEIVFLPDNAMLVTERPGTLIKISPDRQIISEIDGVAHVGEGGLLGMVLHPDFETNHYIYLYLTTRQGNGLVNRVERYKFEGNNLTDRSTIIEGIPGANNHDGGRMAFGPDGKLYITTGDAQQSSNAQNTDSLAGKILRINDNGSIPADNPFGNAVWTYGHRNPQGISWDDQGRMWATEHGPSGAGTGFDEVNLIEKGKNYGWPLIQGSETAEGMQTPVIQSGAADTWAPAGLTYWDGSLFYGGLRGEALYEAKIESSSKLSLLEHLKGEYGRIRAVVLGPDNYFYIATSNTDGRGSANAGDDKIIRINPKIFR